MDVVSKCVIQSVQVGLPKQLGTPGSDDPDDQPWFSGFVKTPVDGPIQIGLTGLDGDGQADLENHGGPDKAVLCYNASHFQAWKIELHRDAIVGGMFGENLTLDHLTEREVCIGDTFLAGAATLQVTQPRQPCWKLARRWDEKQLPKMVIRNGYCGWYCRVLETGLVQAKDPFKLLDRPNPQWTVRDAHHTMYGNATQGASQVINEELSQQRSSLASLAELSEAWKTELQRRV